MRSFDEYTINKKINDEKVFVAYITAGLNGWIETIHNAFDNGVDIVEVGLPFSDPIMDGSVISKASAIALENGAKTFDLLDELGGQNFSKPLAIMTYANVLYSHGLEKSFKKLQDANVKAMIVPDITYENKELFTDPLEDHDISFISLISSTTTPQRRKKIAQDAQGFIYAVAIKGVTGENNSLDLDFINEVKKDTDIPIYTGVGIRTSQDAHNAINNSNGVIVGTSIVEKMIDVDSDIEDINILIKEFRKAIDEENNNGKY